MHVPGSEITQKTFHHVMSSGPHPRDKARLQGVSNNATLARAKVPGQCLGDKLVAFSAPAETAPLRIPVSSAPTHQL